MARITVSLNKDLIRTDANRASRPVVTRVTRKVFNLSQVRCPIDKGYLRASGRTKVVESARGPRGKVEYTAKYAAAVEKGTVPHVIRARKKKALAFEYGGRIVIVKSVRHPGTKEQPFLRTAAEDVAAAEGLRFIRRD